jgi:glycerol kinase
MPEALLAIDVGTSTVRTLVCTPGGNVLAVCREKTESVYPQNGWVEQDANQVWLKVRGLIDRVLEKARLKPADLAALGVTSQRASIVIWDAVNTTAVTPMIVWSDLRGIARAKELGEAGFIAAAQMSSAKLEAAIRVAEQATGQTVFSNPGTTLRWGNIDSFIIAKLTGGDAHITDASQLWPMGYLDLQSFGFNANLAGFQQLPEKIFPRIVDTWGDLAVSSKKVLGAEVPIGAVIADQQSAMFAHACLNPGDCKITFGTAGCLNVSTGHEFKLISESVLPFIQYKIGDVPGFCLEGMMNTAGTLFDWLADDLGLINSVEQISALATEVNDSAGVWVLPSLLGVGAPHGDNQQRMTVGGLHRGSSKAHVIRATLEGIAWRIREIFDHIYTQAELPLPASIGADGGASACDALLQIQADALGVPVQRHQVMEATALGAALCAGMGNGVLTLDDLAGICHYTERFEPGVSPDQSADRFAEWKSRAYSSAPRGG